MCCCASTSLYMACLRCCSVSSKVFQVWALVCTSASGSSGYCCLCKKKKKQLIIVLKRSDVAPRHRAADHWPHAPCNPPRGASWSSAATGKPSTRWFWFCWAASGRWVPHTRCCMMQGGKSNRRCAEVFGRIRKEKTRSSSFLPIAPRWSLKSSWGWGRRCLVGSLRVTEEPK